MRALIMAICLLLMPLAAHAQMAATLVADSVWIEGDNRLVAEGAVEALYDGTRLRASRVTYDRAADRLTVEGPLVLTGATGELLLADSARLDPRFQTGLLLGARLVLEQQLQLAANRVDRVDGRYTQLTKTAITSCAVCSGRAPIWSIRAERVLLDAEAEQFYLEGAQFRVKDVPVLYLPRLRLPTPSNGRATGLLTPRLSTNGLLGPGIRLPYFVALGESRDLTITPYLARETRTLETRYRQAFNRGGVEIRAAASSDSLQDGLRGFVAATGSFRVATDLTLSFDIESASDDAYLSDYDISDTDRLASVVALTRVDDTSLFSTSASFYETLRETESDGSLPPVVLTASYLRQTYPRLGGTLTFSGSADTLLRYGTEDGELARDLSRLGAAATWRAGLVTRGGLDAQVAASVAVDAYQVGDPVIGTSDTLGRFVPTAQLTLRYPLERTTARARHTLEPALALTASAPAGDTPPNEDSARPELDEGNLLAFTQFAGQDAQQDGARAAIGLSWTREGADGVTSTLTLGRVLQDDPSPEFTVASGLDGRRSDWLVAGRLSLPRGLAFDARALVDDAGDVSLSTARLAWETTGLALAASYLDAPADPRIGQFRDLSEYAFDGTVDLTRTWSLSAAARYDLDQDAAIDASLGLGYTNECLRVSLSASRSFASSPNLQPTTDVGVSVDLLGFSARADGISALGRCDT